MDGTKDAIQAIEPLLAQNQPYAEALEAFRQEGQVAVYGLAGSQRPFLIGRALAQCDGSRPLIIVTSERKHKELWDRDLAFWAPNLEILPYPIAERVQFTTAAKSLEAKAQQMRALSALALGKAVCVIATVEECAQKVLSPEELRSYIKAIKLDDSLDIEALLRQFVTMGYERVDQVEQRGHFAMRGDILDIFPVNSENPYRIEFFGDTVDTIRSFSVDTQRSIDNLDDCEIMPFYVADEGAESSLLAYGAGAAVIVDDPPRCREQLGRFHKEDVFHKKDYLTWAALRKSMTYETAMYFTLLQQSSRDIEEARSLGIQGKTISSFERQLHVLGDEVGHWLRLGRQVVIVMANQQRREMVQNLFVKEGIAYVSGTQLVHTPGHVLFLEGLVSEGFELPYSNMVLVTEGNIFGQQKRRARRQRQQGEKINYFTDLSIGDYVVHNTHGIGKYVGLKNLEINGIHKDYVEIAYAGVDTLYLPADNLDQLQKYIGNEGETPKISKMGGLEWKRIRAKAQKSIDDLADKLVKLYAEREVVQGYAFLPDQPWQKEFEDDFPYEETEDQLTATKEIKAAMEKPVPMDMLLCGDVGFGKTEVAMRAIFKAVMSGKQVAVLVPTTILAHQHFLTFTERLGKHEVNVAVINRFTTAKGKREILAGVKDGSVNVLIGTHSLLSKQVEFKNLGLLVVDEEQRFGVAQKEKWKSIAKNIDVLTLSATPIPRTLHMALVGVRSMSVINTPPEDRLPVETYVVEYDMGLIAEAIRREIKRGGQVFFVYNRVASIGHMASLLQEAMPDLKFAIAHGQMSGREIENIMDDFYCGDYDLLLCTSIIETGLDIPNANTIIIYDADHMGLSQLYQMRGRVGRTRRRGYAYFMYRRDKVLTEVAERRLKAVEEFTELGAGYKIAMRDLEIRGAGNLLGSQQHGNIAAVGFALYCSMLEEAIARLKNEKVEDAGPRIEPTIDLGVEAYIDDGYLGDNSRKIHLYQRFLQCHSKEDVDALVDEMIDRFGTPSKAVDALVRIAYIKEMARSLGIKSLVRREDNLRITWQDETPMAGWDMAVVPQELWKKLRFQPVKPMVIDVDLHGVKENVISFAESLLQVFGQRGKGAQS